MGWGSVLSIAVSNGVHQYTVGGFIFCDMPLQFSDFDSFRMQAYMELL